VPVARGLERPGHDGLGYGHRKRRWWSGKEGDLAMTNKRIRLPKEGLIEPEDVRLIDADVEAHGWANPAPPADFSHRSPSQGGEAVPSDDDTDDMKGLNLKS
jgi:hypothetical protein